jgi:hypothetical protein
MKRESGKHFQLPHFLTSALPHFIASPLPNSRYLKSTQGNDEEKRVEKVLFIVLILIVTVAPVFGEDRTFTNNDLQKYRGTPDVNSPEESRSYDSIRDFQDHFSEKYHQERKLKRYFVRYTGSSRRIILPVTFNGHITAPLLMDTGAPGMHISTNLARQLGVIGDEDGELKVMISGIGGKTPAIFTIIDSISVGGVETRFIPTYVSDTVFQNFEGLIGMDFMANYSVNIDTRNRVVVFEERPQSADMPGGRDEAWWRTTFYNFKSLKSEWERYGEELAQYSITTDKEREFRQLVDRQSSRARELYNRLSVYASEHSVPLEWR